LSQYAAQLLIRDIQSQLYHRIFLCQIVGERSGKWMDEMSMF
jgi:hypothetical protein